MVGTFRGLVDQAKNAFASGIDRLARPGIKELVEIAKGEYKVERAFSFVRRVDEVISLNSRVGDKSAKIPQKIIDKLKEIADEIRPAAERFNVMDQKGAVALFQLMHRGEEGQQAFLDFCERHKTYEAGLRIVGLSLQNSGTLDTGYRTEEFRGFVQSLISGADKEVSSDFERSVVDTEKYRVLRADVGLRVFNASNNSVGLDLNHVN